jgi:chromosome segregation ATPase
MAVSRPSTQSGRTTPVDALSRPSTATRAARVLSRPDIKPSQIHELKLQTQQIQQQTVILRSQLKRMQVQINSKTSAINKTFEQSSTKATAKTTIHTNTIPNIRRNIEGARNTLETLREQIGAAERDDKTAAVQELEEELKITYCEYQRLARALQDRQNEAAFYAKALEAAEFRASAVHIRELRMSIDQVREQNAILREKANAYQQKIEKMTIENEIVKFEKERRETQDVINEVEVKQADTNRDINRLCERMAGEAERYEEMVAELSQIIEATKARIAQQLQEMNGDEEIPDVAD